MADQAVYGLVVTVGPSAEDGFPAGAELLCYATGVSEEEAVNETVAVLRRAGLSPLEVSALGTAAEREAEGEAIDPEDRALMDRALAENAVIVASVSPL